MTWLGGGCFGAGGRTTAAITTFGRPTPGEAVSVPEPDNVTVAVNAGAAVSVPEPDKTALVSKYGAAVRVPEPVSAAVPAVAAGAAPTTCPGGGLTGVGGCTTGLMTAGAIPMPGALAVSVPDPDRVTWGRYAVGALTTRAGGGRGGAGGCTTGLMSCGTLPAPGAAVSVPEPDNVTWDWYVVGAAITRLRGPGGNPGITGAAWITTGSGVTAAAGRTAIATPIVFSTVTLDPVAVAVFVPVATAEVSVSVADSIAASDTAATDVPVSVCSVSLASGVNAVSTPDVPLRTAWNVISRQFAVTGVIDGARTDGTVTPVLSSVVGVTSSGVVLSAPAMASRPAANLPDVKLIVGAVSPDCITRRKTPV